MTVINNDNKTSVYLCFEQIMDGSSVHMTTMKSFVLFNIRILTIGVCGELFTTEVLKCIRTIKFVSNVKFQMF